MEALLTLIQPYQSLFIAPCSHVWHYKCIRPIVNDVKIYPHFMCPNCRAVADLEADVEDPADDGWENANGEEPGVDLTSSKNGTVPEQEKPMADSNDEHLSRSTSRLLSLQDHVPATPHPPTSSNNTNGPDSTSGLLSRRGAQPMSPPFTAAPDPSGVNGTLPQSQYLRPITPTQPLMGNEDLNESSMRTPTMTNHFAHDGPMTPTNNAGPFVFDGSAGRVVGRTGTEDLDNSSPET